MGKNEGLALLLVAVLRWSKTQAQRSTTKEKYGSEHCGMDESNSNENDEMGHTARSGLSWAKAITALYVFWRASALTTRFSCLCAKATRSDAPRDTVPLTDLYDIIIPGAMGITSTEFESMK